MKRPALGPLSAVPMALASAALLAHPPATAPEPTPGRKTVAAAAVLLSGEASGNGTGVALLPGGSGVPIPPWSAVHEAFDKYIATHGYPDYLPTRLITPEGLNPIFTPPKSLPLDPSVAQGVTIENNAIAEQFAAGHDVVVGGVSQSATIASLEMRDIVNGSLGFQPTPDQLAFFMVGNPNNPNGGLLSRFDLPVGSHPTIPSLGITFSGGTPADTGWPTYIWTGEYDGFADFPRYTGNVLSDLNAFLGILFVHGEYFDLAPDVIANAIELPTSPGYHGGTTYYLIPTEHLPLAQAIEMLAGKPLADLLEPDLRVLVNLGYGTDPDLGWSDTPADVETPMGLFPHLDADQVNTVVQALVDGAKQGFAAFQTDLADSPPTLLTPPTAVTPVDLTDLPSLTDIVNTLTGVVARGYSVLLPTADIVTALTTTLPSYDLKVFWDSLQAGDLLGAFGLPAAANTGLFTMAAGVAFMTVEMAIGDIRNMLNGVFG